MPQALSPPPPPVLKPVIISNLNYGKILLTGAQIRNTFLTGMQSNLYSVARNPLKFK